MSGCHVIKGNDKPCGNYALKGKTCCWVHRKLEDTPYTEKDGEIKKSVLSESDQCIFICYTGKRCSRKGLSYQEQKMCFQHKSIVRQHGTQKNVVNVVNVESDSESSESEDDYSKDPSYKPSGRSYNGRRTYAAKTTNGEPRCQFVFDDLAQCSCTSENDGRFCLFHLK